MRFTRFLTVLALSAALFAAVRAEAQQIYWLDTRYLSPSINRCNPDGTGLVTLALPAGSLPEGIAVDRALARVFWTEASYSGARVRRAGLDFSLPTDVTTGGSSLRGLALVAPAGPLLWTTSNVATGPTVRRANLDGSSQATVVLLASPGSNPRGIAYQPLPSEFVYVANTDGIYRYTLGGAGGVLVALPPTSRPHGVAVNAAAGLIYWTEYGTGQIRRSTTAGGAVVTLVAGLSNPTYLALDIPGGKIYWVEGGVGAQRIRRANLAGGAPEPLTIPVQAYGGIAILPAGVLSGPDDPPVLELALAAVSPNPARGEARLGFALPSAQRVRLSVLDLQGREVAVLTDGELDAGNHAFHWAPRSANAGVYFAQLRTDGRTLTRRFSVLR